MAVKLGTRAYTGANPIGGGRGHVSSHGFSQAGADYVVRTEAELRSALNLATSREVIWIPDGVTITVSVTGYAGLGTLRSGVALASNRGQNGADGGKIKNTAKGTVFMAPIIGVSSNCILSGMTFEGPGGMCGTSGPGNCAIRGVSGARRIEVENCEIGGFYCGGIYFYGGGMVWNDDGPNGRHWVHHCYIHHVQKHGYGYGICEEGPCSYLAEACRFGACRHEVMAQANSTGLEVRYCEFEDGVYSATYASHQVDSHGGEGDSSVTACKHISVHHNDFSKNETNEVKPNVCIRGTVPYGAEIHHNWTKKLHNGQSGVFSETYPNGAFTVWGGATGTLASYGVKVYDNWYGPTPPPDEEEPQPNGPNIKVVKLEAPEVELGGQYTIKATVLNEGDTAGGANTEIGWITANGSKRKLKTIPVILQPGESKVVEHQAVSTSIGDWKFYCGSLTVILSVVEKPPAVPVIELGAVSVGVEDGKVRILATVTNSGNADGKVVVRLGGDVSAGKEVAVAAGASQEVVFSMMVELDDAG